jgi:hypothetical protein
MKAEFLDSLGLSFYYLDAAFLAVPHRAAGVELVGREPTDAKARKPHGLESTEQAEARQSCPSTPRDWYSRKGRDALTCCCARGHWAMCGAYSSCRAGPAASAVIA